MIIREPERFNSVSASKTKRISVTITHIDHPTIHYTHTLNTFIRCMREAVRLSIIKSILLSLVAEYISNYKGGLDS